MTDIANRLRTAAAAALVLCPMALTSCGGSDDDPSADGNASVTTLGITVTGDDVQAPYGNVYLFHTDYADLDYAIGYGDATQAPLIKVDDAYNPRVVYFKNGIRHELMPISRYGTMADGALDNHSSPRYSQIRFSIPTLSDTYGRVGKDSVVLVVIILNDPQTKTWTARTVCLRRDYLIHVSLPDSKDATYIDAADMSSKWWQVEGEE